VATQTLSDELTPHLDEFLFLEAEASKPYNNFVYDDEAQATELRRLLLEAGVCEFGPPYARLLIDDGNVAGMIACLTGPQVLQVRMKGAMVLLKAGVLSEGLQQRLRLAVQTLIKPQPDDFYLSRIAIDAKRRGRGDGSFLIEHFQNEGRRLGCRRLTLEVNAIDEQAVRFYLKHNFSELNTLEVKDKDSGRSLVYQQMIKKLD